jgi:hypothetical protein
MTTTGLGLWFGFVVDDATRREERNVLVKAAFLRNVLRNYYFSVQPLLCLFLPSSITPTPTPTTNNQQPTTINHQRLGSTANLPPCTNNTTITTMLKKRLLKIATHRCVRCRV